VTSLSSGPAVARERLCASFVPPNRACPGCGTPPGPAWFVVPARAFCDGNNTYRRDWPDLLSIDPSLGFPIVRCSVCRFVFSGWLPPNEFLSTVYEKVIDSDLGRGASVGLDWTGHLLIVAGRLLRAEAARGACGSQGIQVLDLGAGYGTMADVLRTAGLNVFCLEPSPSRRKALASRGLETFEDLARAEGRGPFDLVVLNEVLEHVVDPRGLLARTYRLLKDGSRAWISVPDFPRKRLDAVRRDVARGRPLPKEFNLWEHLNYFSAGSLRSFVALEGFREVAVAPTFDLGFQPRLKGQAGIRNLAGVLWRLGRGFATGRGDESGILVEKAITR
jgi:SAM-dependent methyltransferase